MAAALGKDNRPCFTLCFRLFHQVEVKKKKTRMDNGVTAAKGNTLRAKVKAEKKKLRKKLLRAAQRHESLKAKGNVCTCMCITRNTFDP